MWFQVKQAPERLFRKLKASNVYLNVDTSRYKQKAVYYNIPRYVALHVYLSHV